MAYIRYLVFKHLPLFINMSTEKNRKPYEAPIPHTEAQTSATLNLQAIATRASAQVWEQMQACRTQETNVRYMDEI